MNEPMKSTATRPVAPTDAADAPSQTESARLRKEVVSVHDQPPGHWVGDGFAVRSLFSYSEMGAETSPFLLLDYAAPREFPPSKQRRGVGEHPHRGFETVTICYAGEVEHRDSGGHAGRIGAGDVQWMTAASGVVHEEMHSREFTERGGVMEMAQLWVNLPAELKMSKPRYQEIVSTDVPVVPLGADGGAGTARIIAGSLQTVSGPARTFTPLNVWDVRLNEGGRAELPIPAGHSTTLALFGGAVRINDGPALEAVRIVLLDRVGDHVVLEATKESKLLVLTGEPIDEPIVGYGPFVMNHQGEIHQAMVDYRSGRMGHLS
ncbi:MAG: pirin family protein [Candidatus Eisenbacteria bacterium]